MLYYVKQQTEKWQVWGTKKLSCCQHVTLSELASIIISKNRLWQWPQHLKQDCQSKIKLNITIRNVKNRNNNFLVTVAKFPNEKILFFFCTTVKAYHITDTENLLVYYSSGCLCFRENFLSLWNFLWCAVTQKRISLLESIETCPQISLIFKNPLRCKCLFNKTHLITGDRVSNKLILSLFFVHFQTLADSTWSF